MPVPLCLIINASAHLHGVSPRTLFLCRMYHGSAESAVHCYQKDCMYNMQSRFCMFLYPHFYLLLLSIKQTLLEKDSPENRSS